MKEQVKKIRAFPHWNLIQVWGEGEYPLYCMKISDLEKMAFGC